MATGRFVRVSGLWERTGANYLGEIAIAGYSLVDGDAGGVFPNAIRESLPTFEATPIGESSSDATWQTDWAWKGQTKFTQANLVALANAYKTFWDSVKLYAPTDLRLYAVTTAAMDAQDKMIGGQNYHYLLTPSPGTGTATGQNPPQVSVVVSFRTGARGGKGRGRTYLPLNMPQLSSGLISTTCNMNIRNAYVTMMESARGIGPLPAVVNRGDLRYSAVTRIEIGDQPDIQRRRRQSVPENYTGTNLNLV